MSKSINLDDVRDWVRAYEKSKPDDMLEIKKLLEQKESSYRLLVIGAKLNPGDVHQPHYHNNEAVIVYGLTGQAVATIDGRDVVVSPNTLVYIPPKSVHRFANNSNKVWECIALAIGQKDSAIENVWINQP
ncbi:MAG: cupin domain-containing protein [Nitrososphaerales archaeon]